MIFFSNMELRNSWGWSGRIHAKPKGKHLKLLGCAQHCHCTNLLLGQKSQAPTWQQILCSDGASTAASAAASAKEQPLRVPQHALKSEVTEVPNKSLQFHEAHRESRSQVTKITPPSTKHSTQQRHLAARLRTSFWHRFLSKKLDSIRGCEVWKTCRRASHPPQFLPLQQWPPLRTALLLFPSASDMHRMDFLRVPGIKSIFALNFCQGAVTSGKESFLTSSPTSPMWMAPSLHLDSMTSQIHQAATFQQDLLVSAASCSSRSFLGKSWTHDW